MIIRPLSFNGTSINDGTSYKSEYIDSSQAQIQPSVNANYVKRAGVFPLYSGKDYQPTTYTISIQCLGNFTQQFEDLNALFDTADDTPYQLIVQDEGTTDLTQYYVYATPKSATGFNDGNRYTVTLALDDPIWQGVTLNSQSFLITSATDSTSVTAGGNAESYPQILITPTTQSTTDYLYSLYLQVLPTSTVAWNNRQTDICGATDTTWDTAALITGGKMQASSDPGGAGGDIRVFQDGEPVNFWLSGINTTDTRVWVVADMPPARNMTLKTALTSTDDAPSVILNYTVANKAAISALPNEGRIIIDTSLGSTDSEEFTYTSKTITATRLSFTTDSRGVRATTALAHAANSNVRFLPYDFTVVYGNKVVSAPDIDDTEKPIISLASLNSSFVYTQFWDVTGKRAGIWKPSVLRVSSPSQTRSGVFTSTNDAGDTDPASEMGVMAKSYQASGAWKPDTVSIEWGNYFPDVVASLSSVSGDQYQNVLGIPVVTMQASTDDITYTNLWTVSAQATTDYGTWTTWTKASSDATIPSSTRWLRLYQNGTIAGTTDYSAKVGASGLTVGLTNYPHVMIRTESANCQLNCTIYNDTTGESIEVVYPMALNATLTIDTDPNFPQATYAGRRVNGCVKLSTVRARWLRLAKGANTISFENNLADVTNFTVLIKWRNRMNFL